MSSDFADLARDREILHDFCRSHVPSILAFKSRASFKLNLEETDLGTELHHLTCTGTCIESLLECPNDFVPPGLSVPVEMASEFARMAIERKAEKWKSEGSARIYCRCRALPFVIKHLPDYDKRIGNHIRTILRQLEKEDRFAIGEADPKAKSEKDWYPPNAFHTYWFLSILKELEERFGSHFNKLDQSLSLKRLREQMLLWAKAIAGRQISLHVVKSSTLDSDQLAWSLAILIRFGSDFQSDLADQDFLKEGFSAFFEQQTPAGVWQRGRPLFHYREAGNAYCYIYETFTVLLSTVLERKNEGEFLRATFRPFLSNLMKLWRYADTTKIPLTKEAEPTIDARRMGWSSGHRIDHLYAESWATASVFSYGQTLRRLVGVWTREAAGRQLRQSITLGIDPNATTEIANRGNTWPPKSGSQSVSQQIMDFFVAPAIRSGIDPRLEPDFKPIRTSQARSAILFGPPGTSKTSLARSVARAIGWHYVELHASHFVSDGLPNVQRKADEIFQYLMQLDHTVVLFDEIDELVRERDVEADAFGRFLTTSMLPKLAELWNQRKVIYFIATNHIEYFDRAVTRAQRFDALIFVTPPSFQKKIEELERLINEKLPSITIRRTITESEIDAALWRIECSSRSSPDALLNEDEILAKFIMLRWDQLKELADCLVNAAGASPTALELSKESVSAALNDIADPSLQMTRTYCAYRNAVKYPMRDFGKEVG
jgi:hypothetical protein